MFRDLTAVRIWRSRCDIVSSDGILKFSMAWSWRPLERGIFRQILEDCG